MSELSLCSRLNLLTRGIASCPVPLTKETRISWFFGLDGTLCKATVTGARHDPAWLAVEIQYDSGRAECSGSYEPMKRIVSADEHSRATRRAGEALNFRAEVVPHGFVYPQISTMSAIRVAKAREGVHA